jgi:hypothetical protein
MSNLEVQEVASNQDRRGEPEQGPGRSSIRNLAQFSLSGNPEIFKLMLGGNAGEIVFQTSKWKTRRYGVTMSKL